MNTTQIPSGPPWPLDVVADVHAEVFPPELNRQLREQMERDPEAAELLAVLGGVVDELSLLPPLTMPADVAARLEETLLAESATRDTAPVRPVAADNVRPLFAVPPPAADQRNLTPSGPVGGTVTSLDRARKRRQGWFAGIGAVAAAAAIGTVVMLNLPGSTDGTGVAGQEQVAGVEQLPDLKYLVVLDNGVARPVAVEDRLGCLESLQVPAASVLGIADGAYSGDDASVIVTTEGAGAGQVRLLIVAAGCSADGATVLAEELRDR